MNLKQDISINGLLFQTSLDMDSDSYKNYVMLRSYNLDNNVIRDRELLFIEKDLLTEEFYKYLLFPVEDDDFKSYSQNLIDFNQDMFGVKDEDILNSPLAYKLVDKNNQEMNIKTSKLRIYKPHILDQWDKLPMVIHVYSFINNVKVHLFVRTSDWLTDQNVKDKVINSESETSINHFVYSEYAEIEIPDVDFLFSGDVYFENNLNKNEIVSVGEDEEFFNHFKDYVINDGDLNLLSLRLFNVPFFIKTLKDVKNTQLIALSESVEVLPEYVKCYVPEYLHSNRMVDFEFPVNILLYPYDGFNSEGMIQPSETYNPNADVFFDDSRIRLSSSFGFDENGGAAIINTFKYPNKDRFENFREAYQYFNGVDLRDYENIIDDEDDWWDENTDSTPQLGVRFEIFSDKKCVPDTKIYSESYFFETDTKKKIRDIDDFTFSLKGLFSDWEQMPETMFGRCMFIDKYIGKVIIGTQLYISKEQFKYLIDQSDIGTVEISKIGTNFSKDAVSKDKQITKQDIINKIDKSRMDLSKINLLNNVTVNLIEKDEKVSKSDLKNNVYTGSTSATSRSASKIIYKPIFYRVQSLQSLSILPNVGQNVAVNLMNYMTKVETFKMIIGNYSIVETARNNAYVIFTLSAAVVQYLASTSGANVYYITNQDDELVSSGSWSINY
jgi:hypothetical protein